MNGGEGEGRGGQIDCTPLQKKFTNSNFCPDFSGHEGKQLDKKV